MEPSQSTNNNRYSALLLVLGEKINDQVKIFPGLLNKRRRMHKRNRYDRQRPDFRLLAQRYPELGPFVINGEIDFKSVEAVVALNRALLWVDFGLDVHLPKGRLCPTIANRLDYLHILEDILKSSKVYFNLEKVQGLDIGTGASCIYPLLGARLHGNWKFTGTEVDKVSASMALENVKRNKLEDQIRIIPIESQDLPLLKVIDDDDDDESFHFCMCNPPFYSDTLDITTRRNSKVTPAGTRLEYSNSESVYPGGEVAFISRIIKESLERERGKGKGKGGRILWYTSLIGKKESINQLKGQLDQGKVPRVKIISTKTGNTKRWVLAWSFNTTIIPTKLNSKSDGSSSSNPIGREEFKIILSNEILNPSCWVKDTFEKLEILPSDHECKSYFTTRRTWGRKGQRQQLYHGRGLNHHHPPPFLKLNFTLEFQGQTVILGFDDSKLQRKEIIALINYLRRLSSGAIGGGVGASGGNAIASIKDNKDKERMD